MKANKIDASFKDIPNTRLKRGVFSTEIYLKARHDSNAVRLDNGKIIASQIQAINTHRTFFHNVTVLVTVYCYGSMVDSIRILVIFN